MSKIKRMDIAEFRRLGYLQEVNRCFLHKLGLALEVVIDDKTGEERLGGIWDYRDDPEGMAFGDAPDLDKAVYILNERKRREGARFDRWGWIEQPCGVEAK